MITEAPAPLATLTENVEHLRSDLENIQRELDQALDVWRSALLTEKKEFQVLLQTKQQLWNEEDLQWQQQREGYEHKIDELRKALAEQTALTEQNALRALNELDDSWQRDKLQWGLTSSRRIKELEAHEAARDADRQKQESTILELRQRIAQLEIQTVAQQTELTAKKEESDKVREVQESWVQELQDRIRQLDAQAAYQRTSFDEKQREWDQTRQGYEQRIQELEASLVVAAERPPILDTLAVEETKAAWDRDKAVWQQSLFDSIRQLNEREVQWNEDRQKQDRVLHKLQEEIVELQSLLAGLESNQTVSSSHSFVATFVESLESQVNVLHELTTHVFSPQPQPTLIGHPMRRKTDLPYAFR